jgi:hypothetical protein
MYSHISYVVQLCSCTYIVFSFKGISFPVAWLSAVGICRLRLVLKASYLWGKSYMHRLFRLKAGSGGPASGGRTAGPCRIILPVHKHRESAPAGHIGEM